MHSFMRIVNTDDICAPCITSCGSPTPTTYVNALHHVDHQHRRHMCMHYIMWIANTDDICACITSCGSPTPTTYLHALHHVDRQHRRHMCMHYIMWIANTDDILRFRRKENFECLHFQGNNFYLHNFGFAYTIGSELLLLLR